MKLSGRSALVTGGTRGIGAAIADRLLAEGAVVTVTGTSRGGAGPAGTAFRAVDFTDIEATEQFVAEVAALDFDILVNNAGINKIGPFADIDPQDFDRIQRVNVRAPFRLCQAVIPHMRKQAWGRIVTVSSIFGVISREYRAPYSASKFAVDGMTVALAAEVAQNGILANCVAPGFIDTDLTRKCARRAGDGGTGEPCTCAPPWSGGGGGSPGGLAVQSREQLCKRSESDNRRGVRTCLNRL
jgi:NAD(P)-dependent dehydrogenase (short-subunit alcohol dehydrogenase family)